MTSIAAKIRKVLLDAATGGQGTTETGLALRAYDDNSGYRQGSQPDELIGFKWGPTHQISLDELTDRLLGIVGAWNPVVPHATQRDWRLGG